MATEKQEIDAPAEPPVTVPEQPKEVEISSPPSSVEADEKKTDVTIGKSPEKAETPRNEEADLKSMSGRLSQTDKKNNELREERDTLKKQQEVVLKGLNPIFRNNPALYEQWREGVMKEGIDDPGEHYSHYGGQQPQPATQPTQPAQTPQDIGRIVDQRYEDRIGFDKFKEKYPEMDPGKLQGEEKEVAGKVWERMAVISSAMKQANPSMSTEEAFDAAYLSLPENQGKAIERAKLAGELKGRANAYATGAGTASPASGSKSVTSETQTVPMNAGQLAKYEEFKARDPKLAELFAEGVRDFK